LVALVAAAASIADCGGSPVAPSSGPVDVLDFVIGDPSLWPRHGDQSQQQVLDTTGREVCWIKYTNGQMFECWRWDDEWIYHRVDHGIDGNTGESYEFTDGRWLPRQFTGTWTLDVAGNRILWFDRNCQLNPDRSGDFPYRQSAWIEPAKVINADLGVRDVLVLEYRPATGANRDYFERFSFARGAGWYAWQSSLDHDVRFDRVGGVTRARGRFCGE
jgi:hypothetical protein